MSTVLVIDDQPDIRLLLRAVLVRLGWTVIEASTGPDALTLLAQGVRPDVVILDVQMPDMDGWDTLAAIRRSRLTSEIAVILCTVKSQPEDARRAWQLGCDGYLTKPFSLDSLGDEVTIVAARTLAERLATRAARVSVPASPRTPGAAWAGEGDGAGRGRSAQPAGGATGPGTATIGTSTASGGTNSR